MSRHRWSDYSRPTDTRTERTCIRCGIVRVMRHDSGRMEFYEPDTGLLIEGRRTGDGDASWLTPACEGVRKARAT